jgi:CRP-like cAMP-binding protein
MGQVQWPGEAWVQRNVGPMLDSSTPVNRVLAALPAMDLGLLEPHLEIVEFRQGTHIHRLGERLEHVVFPYNCLISINAVMDSGNEVECAMVGPEGTVGAYGGHGIDHAVTDATVKITGIGVQISVADFRHALAHSETLADQVARCEALLVAQMHQSAACNAVHDVEARMCRWLLEIDDRMGGSRFPMTQDMLAKMLGVRRTTVTLVAKRLQQVGAFRWRRGYVYVLQRDLIADRACACYERVRLCAERLSAERSSVQALAEREQRPQISAAAL